MAHSMSECVQGVLSLFFGGGGGARGSPSMCLYSTGHLASGEGTNGSLKRAVHSQAVHLKEQFKRLSLLCFFSNIVKEQCFSHEINSEKSDGLLISPNKKKRKAS